MSVRQIESDEPLVQFGFPHAFESAISFFVISVARLQKLQNVLYKLTVQTGREDA